MQSHHAWPESTRLTHCTIPTQGFEVVRLKDKLGTKQLPTAELALDGLRALKVCDVIVAWMQEGRAWLSWEGRGKLRGGRA